MGNTHERHDIIVIGAGLVGLSTAYHLQKRFPDKRILILEKEKTVAAHQSSHNSGVIHSGIYYKPGSLKAQNCTVGYQKIIEFAREHNVPFDICGKLIVSTNAKENEVLGSIYDRGVANGLTELKMVSREEIKEIEPHVVGEKAIWVPQAGIIDFPAVADRLRHLFVDQQGGILHLQEEVVGIREEENGVSVDTLKKSYSSRYLISCAGLHSDRVTKLSDQGNDLRIIPFKGCYYKLKPEKEYLIRNLVYPVPDPKFPFLGVHFTRMIRGGVEAGPNAVLSLKREGYSGRSVSLKDTMGTASWPGFWKIALKYGKTGMGEVYRTVSKRAFTRALQKLVPEITMEDIAEGGAGVRAQACDRNGMLIDDFDIKRIGRTLHVRNAPSPAATSCLAIGQSIVNEVVGMVDR